MSARRELGDRLLIVELSAAAAEALRGQDSVIWIDLEARRVWITPVEDDGSAVIPQARSARFHPDFDAKP